MLFMLTIVLLMLLAMGIFYIPIGDDDSPPNDLTSFRRRAFEKYVIELFYIPIGDDSFSFLNY